MLGLAQQKLMQKANKKRKKVYEMNHQFQDIWVTKLPWAKSVVGDGGRMK
jgi:hypothetical protein